MTKPSQTKTGARRGRPPKPKPENDPADDLGTAATKPQAVAAAEAPVVPPAAPEDAEPANAVTDAVAPQDNPADEGVQEKDEGETSSDPVPSAEPERVTIAGVPGVLRRIPVGLAQTVVGPELTKRAASLNGKVVSDLQSRMLATDGRCAPMIFTVADPANREELPRLFAGIEILAAAMAAGMEEVFVIIIAQSEADRVQGNIATSLHLLKDVDQKDYIWRGMRKA